MSSLTSRMLICLAASGMVLAPISASAATRASDNSYSYSATDVLPGQGREIVGRDFDDEHEHIHKGGYAKLWYFLGGAVVFIGAFVLAGGNSSNGT
jgi:hypothetical protein